MAVAATITGATIPPVTFAAERAASRGKRLAINLYFSKWYSWFTWKEIYWDRWWWRTRSRKSREISGYWYWIKGWSY